MNDSPRYWFGPKLYGWGYRHPLNWQGWVAYAVWTALFLAPAPIMQTRQHPFFDLGYFFGMLGVLLGMCKWKGVP